MEHPHLWGGWDGWGGGGGAEEALQMVLGAKMEVLVDAHSVRQQRLSTRRLRSFFGSLSGLLSRVDSRVEKIIGSRSRSRSRVNSKFGVDSRVETVFPPDCRLVDKIRSRPPPLTWEALVATNLSHLCVSANDQS